MSNHKLREDNICQNCHYTVDRAYCSNCGQKNTETRQSFLYLITHFAEDFTHYDGAFWKTMKHLLFRPARLTKEYLSGKRQTYVPPVKLYIFISFVTFFVLAIGSRDIADETPEPISEADKVVSINFASRDFKSYDELKVFLESNKDTLNSLEYWIGKTMVIANDKNLSGKQVFEAYLRTLPKVLFIYMPIFAFWLWLFHGKKKWYFFDHGIFTLHYFAFLLLSITLIDGIITLSSLFSDTIYDYVRLFSIIILSCYWFFYFFRAHSRMYDERKSISRLKSFALFFINLLCISIALVTALFYVLNTIH